MKWQNARARIMFSFLKKVLGIQRTVQEAECYLFSDVDLSLVVVGDVLIRKADLRFKPKHAHYDCAAYSDNIRFTAGKEYHIVRIRLKSKVVFLVDDGGFTVPINRYQQSFFNFRQGKLAGSLSAAISQS